MAMWWRFRGLSWRDLAKNTWRRTWQDEVFGHAARLAFYYFFGIFPAFLLLLLLLHGFAGTGSELRTTLLNSFQRVVPQGVSPLLAKTIGELNQSAAIGAGVFWAALSAAWAMLNGTWAMMVGLNQAYEVKEKRPLWRVLTIAFVLTISLAIMGLMSLAAMLYGNRSGTALSQHLGVPLQPALIWRVMQLSVIGLLLFFSFTALYRFGPNLKHSRWKWSMPGAVIAIALWAVSTGLLRIYQEHFSSHRVYAELQPVVELLLWLYFTSAAILIGAEANAQIKKAAAPAGQADLQIPEEKRDGETVLEPDVS